MLQAPAVAGSDAPRPSHNGKGTALADRRTWENHVVRMDEEGANAILIAARTTLFESLELLHEKNFNERDDAQTRLLICKATLRKPVGYLGKEIVVCGFQRHYKTMKREHPRDAITYGG